MTRWWFTASLAAIGGSIYGLTHPVAVQYYAKKALSAFNTHVSVEHREHYDKARVITGRTVAVFNHGHFLDTLALIASFGATPFVVLEKHIDWLPMRQIVERMGCLILPSQTESHGVTKKIADKLESRQIGGHPLFIAPDGGWSTEGSWAPWRTGAFVHSETIVPILVVYHPKMPDWPAGESLKDAATKLNKQQTPLQVRLYVMEPICRKKDERPNEYRDRVRVVMEAEYRKLKGNAYRGLP